MQILLMKLTRFRYEPEKREAFSAIRTDLVEGLLGRIHFSNPCHAAETKPGGVRKTEILWLVRTKVHLAEIAQDESE